MTQVLIDKQVDTVIISVDPAVMKVYGAEAKQRGLPSGTALIEALIADWPAILAPAQSHPEPRERTTEDQVASLSNLMGLALARIAILENAPGPGAFYTPESLGAPVEIAEFLATLPRAWR